MVSMELGARLIKNGIHTLFNTFFMRLLSWGVSIWITRALGPANFGIFSLVLWFTGIFSWALGMGLIHAITKYVAEYHAKQDLKTIKAIIWFVLKIEIVITAGATIVLVFFRAPIADYFFTPNESIFFLLAFLGLVPGVVTAIFSASIEGIQKFEYFTYVSLIVSPLSFIAKVVVLFFGYGINGLLMVMLVFSFVNCVVYALFLLREKILFPFAAHGLDASVKKRINKYNASVIAILCCDKIVWDKSENFFLGRFCSASEIGFFNLGYNFAQNCMGFIPTTLWRILFPAMSAFYGAGSRDKMKRLFFLSSRYVAFFVFPVGVAGILLSFGVLKYVYGQEFVGAQRVMQIMFGALILSSISNPGSAVLYSFEKQSFIYKYGLVLAVLNILLDIWLIRTHGALGAALCYGITTILASIGGLAYTIRTMSLKYPIVSVVKIIFSTLIMGIVMELILQQNWNGLGIILALVAGAFTYCICSLVLGSFEEEDFVLLDHVKRMLPGKSKVIIEKIAAFMSNFKRVG